MFKYFLILFMMLFSTFSFAYQNDDGSVSFFSTNTLRQFNASQDWSTDDPFFVLYFRSGGLLSGYKTGFSVQDGVSETATIVGQALVYPNPFSLSEISDSSGDYGAEIGYELTESTSIEIIIFDMRAHEIARLSYPSGSMGGTLGYNKVKLNQAVLGRNLPSNVYFFYVLAGERVLEKGKFLIKP